MIIIPNNLYSTIYPSAQDTKVLVKDSEEFCQLCEKSLTRKSKTTLSPTWLRRLKKGDYIQLLFSRTLKPSHSESFLEKYLSSVEDSHVSPLVKLVSEKQPMTQDTSIPSSQKESHNANQLSFFSKMYKELSQPKPTKENLYSTMSAETWKAEVTKCRGEYSQRKNSAFLTKEKGSLSWGTPTEQMSRASQFDRGKHNLGEQVQGMNNTMNFPTPSVAGCVEGGVAKNVKITPTGFKATRENGTTYGAKLRDAVLKNWSTPTARDFKDSPNDKTGLAMTLGRQVNGWKPKSQQDQTNLNTNGNTQESLLRGYLNPNWVESLMGLDIGLTDLGYSEMESCHK
jgi:hypothetical protein